MKAILSGLALSTAVFAAHAEPPVVDKDAQTVTWSTESQPQRDSRDVKSLQILNCRFGTLSHRTSDYRGGVAMVDLLNADQSHSTVHYRTEKARETCKKNGLTPEF